MQNMNIQQTNGGSSWLIIWFCIILGMVYGLLKHNHDATSIVFWVFIAHIILLGIQILVGVVIFGYIYVMRKRMEKSFETPHESRRQSWQN